LAYELLERNKGTKFAGIVDFAGRSNDWFPKKIHFFFAFRKTTIFYKNYREKSY